MSTLPLPFCSSRKALRATLALVIFTLALPVWEGSNAYADPPPWAPAYGYRNKHHHDHEGDDNEGDDHDEHRVTIYREAVPVPAERVVTMPYGIDQGTCNRQLLGQVLGGATGAALGSTIGKGNGKTAAILGGTIVGVIVGGNIGQSMDRIDQGCVGQVLEHASDGRQVAWTDPNGGARYDVTPDKPYRNQQGQYCRQYLTNAVIDGQKRQISGLACRQQNGVWQMVN